MCRHSPLSDVFNFSNEFQNTHEQLFIQIGHKKSAKT